MLEGILLSSGFVLPFKWHDGSSHGHPPSNTITSRLIVNLLFYLTPCTASGDWLSMAASGVGAAKKKGQQRKPSATTSGGWMSGTLGAPVDDEDDEGEDLDGQCALPTLVHVCISSIKRWDRCTGRINTEK